jgi:hypothetical protein
MVKFTGSSSIGNSSYLTEPGSVNFLTQHINNGGATAARFSIQDDAVSSDLASKAIRGARQSSEKFYFALDGRGYLLNGLGINGTSGVSGGQYPLYVNVQNASNESIYALGNIIANSDVTTKENIKTIENALAKVMQLRGVTFTRKDSESDKVEMGLIAQEVNPIVPEVVSHVGDAGKMALAYQNLVGLLIEAMKEQQIQIDELKNKLGL